MNTGFNRKKKNVGGAQKRKNSPKRSRKRKIRCHREIIVKKEPVAATDRKHTLVRNKSGTSSVNHP